jgi:hypothetical protein
MRVRLALFACLGTLALLGPPAAQSATADAGYVSGVVFEDVNGDGLGPQPGENGLVGWLVWVDLVDKGVYAGEPAGTVGADGAYRLGPLAPGAYTVRIQPTGGACPAGAVCEHVVPVGAGGDTKLDFPVATGGVDPGRILVGEGGIKVGLVRLRVPHGCRRIPFQAAVTGNGITRVVFSLDGRTFRNVRRPNRAGRFAVRVDPRRLRRGRHALSAVIHFGRAPGTATKRVRRHFRSCANG